MEQTEERKFLGFSFTAGPDVKRTIAPKSLERFKQGTRENYYCLQFGRAWVYNVTGDCTDLVPTCKRRMSRIWQVNPDFVSDPPHQTDQLTGLASGPHRGTGIMDVIKTDIPGALVVVPRVLGDARGFFLEMFQSERYAASGISGPFVQDNLSRSAHGVLRGLHLQNPNPQGKLVTVLRGRVLDVALDVRRGSPTFGRHVAVELSDDNRRQLFVPRGFAHGFVVVSNSADLFYKCDAPYHPADEIVVRWNDPAIGITWGVENPTLSARDAAAPALADIASRLPVWGEV